MTFTYDLASSTEATRRIAKVRLELGDTAYGLGVKPDNSNFSDEEIAIWLEEESNHVMHAVIRVCDVLARLWSNVATLTEGPRKEEFGKITDNWAKQAQALREQYGNPSGGSTIGTAFAVASDRVDGYSEEADEAA